MSHVAIGPLMSSVWQKVTNYFCRIKLQELQEAWEHQQCTSTVSVPIPASRHFEDAFTPYADRHLPPPERGTCPVLYAANGTVGVLHFGLSTEDVKLNGR